MITLQQLVQNSGLDCQTAHFYFLLYDRVLSFFKLLLFSVNAASRFCRSWSAFIFLLLMSASNCFAHERRRDQSLSLQ